jgi:hypothetical protein
MLQFEAPLKPEEGVFRINKWECYFTQQEVNMKLFILRIDTDVKI